MSSNLAAHPDSAHYWWAKHNRRRPHKHHYQQLHLLAPNTLVQTAVSPRDRVYALCGVRLWTCTRRDKVALDQLYPPQVFCRRCLKLQQKAA